VTARQTLRALLAKERKKLALTVDAWLDPALKFTWIQLLGAQRKEKFEFLNVMVRAR
jgi:hypothetical protein